MIEFLIAFGAGLISFLSPCVLPLIPGYISFISGSSLNELLAKKKINLIPLILFTLGFSFVFIIFGAAASFLGQIFLQNSQTLRIIAGLIIIVFSLQLIGIINISFLNFEKKIYTKNNSNILRIKILDEKIKKKKILILFRNPINQCFSLWKQHINLIKLSV